MKAIIIKGPHFEQTEKKVYEYLSKIIFKEVAKSEIKEIKAWDEKNQDLQ
jgi:hypothetical protein